MLHKENRLLQIGILGCGPIAQFAHFEAAQKSKNVELYAICDAAEDLLHRMATLWQPKAKYNNYDDMLADPKIEAVIIAISDAFHLPMAIKAVEAGKHVLVEKPVGTSLEASEELHCKALKNKVVVQVGHMKRFDLGISSAHDFIKNELGEMMLFKGWYNDNTHRYTVTDNVQPLPVFSSKAIKPPFNEKADKTRYYLLAHGSHLLDTAYFLAGPIGKLKASLVQKFGAYCWGIQAEFLNGATGYLDLMVPLRGDWKEGFSVAGEQGSIDAKIFNPWYFKSSEVRIFSERDASYKQILGADGNCYRLQLEAFAEIILHGKKQDGTSIGEGIENIRMMLAIQHSVISKKEVYVDSITEGTL